MQGCLVFYSFAHAHRQSLHRLGAVAYRALGQDPADGKVEASGSQLLIAIIAPPAEASMSFSFFGQIVEEDLDVLSSLTISDTIQTITITEE